MPHLVWLTHWWSFNPRQVTDSIGECLTEHGRSDPRVINSGRGIRTLVLTAYETGELLLFYPAMFFRLACCPQEREQARLSEFFCLILVLITEARIVNPRPHSRQVRSTQLFELPRPPLLPQDLEQKISPSLFLLLRRRKTCGFTSK